MRRLTLFKTSFKRLPTNLAALLILVLLVGDDAEPLAGICLGADDDGALLLGTGGGVQRIFSGDLSLRRA